MIQFSCFLRHMTLILTASESPTSDLDYLTLGIVVIFLCVVNLPAAMIHVITDGHIVFAFTSNLMR